MVSLMMSSRSNGSNSMSKLAASILVMTSKSSSRPDMRSTFFAAFNKNLRLISGSSMPPSSKVDESLDVEDGGFEFMGEVADEFLPKGVRLPQVGDFVDLGLRPRHHIAVDLLDNVVVHVEVDWLLDPLSLRMVL